MKDKLFFYDYFGNERLEYDESIVIISEAQLPREEVPRPYKRICATLTNTIEEIKVGDIVDIVATTHFILRNVEYLDMKENPIPITKLNSIQFELDQEPESQLVCGFFSKVFNLNKKRIWIWDSHTCLLPDSLKK